MSKRESLTQRGFRQDIEGLRAVAVVAVVLFHAAVPGLGGGYVGVDVFFVISGFLITGLLWREVSSTGSVRLRAFYGARARRLLPASAMVGVVTMIASLFLLPPLQAPSVLYDGIFSALYVSNYRFMQEGVNYFSAANHLSPSPFLHYWSLGVEEQFYLVWAPLILGTAWLIRLIRRRSKSETAANQRPYLVALALVMVVSFAMSFVATNVVPAAAFYSLPTRAWQLALGGLVALTAGQWRRLSALPAAILGWAGLALILLSCIWFSPTTPFPGTAALLPTVGTALVIGAGGACSRTGADASWDSGRWARSVASRTRGTCGTGPSWYWPRCSSASRWGCPRGWLRPSCRLASPGSLCVSSRTRCGSARRSAVHPGAAWPSAAWLLRSPYASGWRCFRWYRSPSGAAHPRRR